LRHAGVWVKPPATCRRHDPPDFGAIDPVTARRSSPSAPARSGRRS